MAVTVEYFAILLMKKKKEEDQEDLRIDLFSDLISLSLHPLSCMGSKQRLHVEFHLLNYYK